MQKYTLYIGTQYDRNQKALKNPAALVELAKKMTAEVFGGFSATTAQGGYIMQATGDLVTEQSLVLTVFADDVASIVQHTKKLCALFSQESVLLEMPDGSGSFVSND